MIWWAHLLLTFWHSTMLKHVSWAFFYCGIWETVVGKLGIATHIVWGNRWSRNNILSKLGTLKAVIWSRHDLMGRPAPHFLTFKDVKYVSWASFIVAFEKWPRHDLMGGPAPHLLTFKDVKDVSWAFSYCGIWETVLGKTDNILEIVDNIVSGDFILLWSIY